MENPGHDKKEREKKESCPSLFIFKRFVQHGAEEVMTTTASNDDDNNNSSNKPNESFAPYQERGGGGGWRGCARAFGHRLNE